MGDGPHCAGLQIGLNPLWVYAGGVLLWCALLLQVLCAPRAISVADVWQDIGSCCITQRAGTVFLLEALCAWSDFVSDLSVALNICFPRVALFVLMWVFLGAQIFPYMYVVFFVRPPAGLLMCPCSPLFDWRYPLAAPLVVAAAQLVGRLFSTLVACWDQRSCAKRFALVLLAVCGGLVLAIVFAAIGLVLLIAVVAVCAVLWLSAWVLLIVLEVLLRIILWAIGFLLYIAKVLPFPVTVTQLFFALWCGRRLAEEQEGPGEDSVEKTQLLEDDDHFQASVFEMTHQGVNVFTLHFSYLAELLLETIAQLVLQILVAALGGGWSLNVIASIVLSSLMTVVYLSRYFYWLVLRPCWLGGPPREHLLAMHQFYYSLTTDNDRGPQDAGNWDSN